MNEHEQKYVDSLKETISFLMERYKIMSDMSHCLLNSAIIVCNTQEDCLTAKRIKEERA